MYVASVSGQMTDARPRPGSSEAGVEGGSGLDGERPAKIAADQVFAGALLVLATPILLVCAALIRLTTPGPALYRQVRLGRGGRPFVLYKLRTMARDCERATGVRWSVPGDPRVTAIGRVLRRTHLDELPQLWNVLRGEMRLIGPRPERPEIVAQLVRALPRYRERLAVRPGITGLAQVQLPPDTDLDSVRRKLACDLDYIRRRGPGLDLLILLATGLHVVGVPYATTGRLLRGAGGQPDPARPAALRVTRTA